jgi:hypothetical protein
VAKHRYDETPAIKDKPRISNYEVLPAVYGDYSEIRLRDSDTGTIYTDGAVMQLWYTNINTSVIKKLIGKKIRVISYTEIIE